MRSRLNKKLMSRDKKLSIKMARVKKITDTMSDMMMDEEYYRTGHVSAMSIKPKIKTRVYLAGGWFDDEQLSALQLIERILDEFGQNIIVYSPRKVLKLTKKSTKAQQDKVFNDNLKAINDADLIIASTVNKDAGTMIELGYAYAQDKPIVATLFTSENISSFNVMLAKLCTSVYMSADVLKFIKFISELNENGLTAIKDAKQAYKGVMH